MKPYEILNNVMTETTFMSREPLVHFWHSDTNRFNCTVTVFLMTVAEKQKIFSLLETFPNPTKTEEMPVETGTVLAYYYGSFPNAECSVRLFIHKDAQ